MRLTFEGFFASCLLCFTFSAFRILEIIPPPLFPVFCLVEQIQRYDPPHLGDFGRLGLGLRRARSGPLGVPYFLCRFFRSYLAGTHHFTSFSAQRAKSPTEIIL